MFKNVSSQKIALFAFDTTTGAAKTGDSANITVYVSKDYGSVTQLTDTSATELDSTNAKGWYLFDVTQGETNADTLLFTGKSTTSNISVVGQLIYSVPANFTTLSVDGNGRVDVIKIAGTTQTARDIGASVLLSSGSGTGQLDFTSGVVKANVTQFGGSNGTFASGRPEVNTSHIAGSAVSTTSAQIGVNVVNLGGSAVDASSGLINANVKQISTDATAADNLEAALDGTGGVTISAALTGNITGNLSGSVGSVTGNVGGNVTGSVGSVAAGGIAASSFAAGAIDAAAIAADAIGSSELAASAVAEIADQVWEEAIADHSGTAGSTAEQLAAAGAAGDPWSTTLPGAYGSGTAGKIVGDNLNATVSSRATQTSVDTIDDFVNTEVAAIKAKTDQLTFTNAGKVDATTITNSDKTGYRLDATGSAALTEGYAADGATATIGQLLYMIWSMLAEANASSTTITTKKLDGSTSAMTFTIDDANTPSTITRAS